MLKEILAKKCLPNSLQRFNPRGHVDRWVLSPRAVAVARDKFGPLLPVRLDPIK